MTGICEVAPIGEDLSCASIFPAIAGVGTVLPEGCLRQRASSPDFSGPGNGEEKQHWESFKTEPQSLAAAVRLLGEGISRQSDGSVKASEGLAKPGDGIANERVEIGKLNDVPIKLNKGFVKSSEGLVTSYEEVVKAADGIVRPSEAPVKASEALAKPGEVIANSREEIGKPSDAPVKSNEGLVTSYEEVVRVADGIVRLNEVPVKASEALAKPSEVIANNREETGKLSEVPVKSNEGLVTSYEEVVRVADGIVRPNEAPVKASEALAKPSEGIVADEREEIGKVNEGRGNTVEVVDKLSEDMGGRVFQIDAVTQLPTAGFQLSASEIQVARPNLQALNRQFVSAANAVAESIAVSPAAGPSNEREIRIRLKADVLDGSSIKIEANGSELKITVMPASRAAEEMLLKNSELFQAQLAERVANWRINVGVAALGQRANHKSEEET